MSKGKEYIDVTFNDDYGTGGVCESNTDAAGCLYQLKSSAHSQAQRNGLRPARLAKGVKGRLEGRLAVVV